MCFDILAHYNLDTVIISDSNAELINTYRIIRDKLPELIADLQYLKKTYLSADDTEKKIIYCERRAQYNALKAEGCGQCGRAALFIFLNKTCFNGLYRENRAGEFNVPAGRYKNPSIFDEENLRQISRALKQTDIRCTDYSKTLAEIDNKTFVYLDPPYRPISKTSYFTAYTKDLFDDNAQRNLAAFFNLAAEKGAQVLMSNSDPKNTDTSCTFFDDLYSGHTIRRIEANRSINCNGKARGKIHEILVSNYQETTP